MLVQPDPFAGDFLSATDAGRDAFRHAIGATERALIDRYGNQVGPYAGATPAEIAQRIAAIEVCPEDGIGIDAAIALVGDLVLDQSVVVADPTCFGHLHCPPLVPGIAAELMIAATNQSMDSWDQAPAATYLEQHIVEWLGQLYGLGPSSDGIFTSGGTQSNFMALLLARNLHGRRMGWRVRERGLPAEAARLRILCSDVAHFSVQQSAMILGLGEAAVVTVASDATRRMDVDALRETIAMLRAEGNVPFCVVGTAGTTDFGSIDPLEAMADLCRQHDIWFHVDAAFGGALALSDRHRHLLAGIEHADSVTIDFHKLFYQPISCSVFLVRDKTAFSAISLHADYLNPEENVEAGVLDLVGKSIQTTRRFDGLKPFLTMQTLGRKRLAAMIDTTIEVAARTAEMIDADPEFELAGPATINALVFRFTPAGVDARLVDDVNRHIRSELLYEGRALLAGTRIGGHSHLKFTMLNPRTTVADAAAILSLIKQRGHALIAAQADIMTEQAA